MKLYLSLRFIVSYNLNVHFIMIYLKISEKILISIFRNCMSLTLYLKFTNLRETPKRRVKR